MTAYPTGEHERAAREILGFFAGRPETDAVLLTNSCARGKATGDSCLDLLVLSEHGHEPLYREWERFHDASDAVAALRAAGRWSEVHLDVEDGVFTPGPILHEFDWFEVRVGNALVYSVSLYERGDLLERLRAQWLPFYDESLRTARLDEARRYCLEFLERIPWYLDRELWFQALDRLHCALRGFLLGLHVSRRVYPIGYDKWIHEQVVENLGLPEVYERLPPLFELGRLESRELEGKAAQLRELVTAHVVD